MGMGYFIILIIKFDFVAIFLHFGVILLLLLVFLSSAVIC